VKKMNPIVENLTGTSAMTDQVIGTDLLFAAKTGMKSCVIALSESATPEVRTFLRGQLEESIVLHEKITTYMMNKGWYHPYDAKEQIQLDMQNAQTALNLS
jgi:similar to spore coat protein